VRLVEQLHQLSIVYFGQNGPVQLERLQPRQANQQRKGTAVVVIAIGQMQAEVLQMGEAILPNQRARVRRIFNREFAHAVAQDDIRGPPTLHGLHTGGPYIDRFEGRQRSKQSSGAARDV